MNRTDDRSKVVRARQRALTLILTLALSGCGVARQVEQAPTSQADVSSRVKLALIEDQAIDAAAIRVAADKNSVTLSGFVADENERRRAVQAARAAAGDFTLVDDITIQR